MEHSVNLVFPHQLFEKSPLLENTNRFILIEEHLFFNQYKFHQQKIAFHRASMRSYKHYLEDQGKKVTYIESHDEFSDIRKFDQLIEKERIETLSYIDTCDNWLESRLKKSSTNIAVQVYESPQFLNTKKELSGFFRKDKKSFFQTSFYKQERKKRKILLDENAEPLGGKWTFDAENRKKYPKGKNPPAIQYPAVNQFWDEAISYTKKYFPNNPGKLNNQRYYPIDFNETTNWFQQFLQWRFYDFGLYEDAIVQEESILNHSVLSPLLNAGLILPQDIIDMSLDFTGKENIPINSTEGFIRQIIGWREFIRGMYLCKGSYSRTKNFWQFNRKIPPSFYDGTTGIIPIDATIKKVLKTGYCHHIERLMVLGNFMLLCEFDPDEVYQWFMELFIDAYDWVMVPNVYGMCLFADGGTFATKPYIGGSNYIKKMSNYQKGDWEKIWDGLFWRFIHQHQDFFKSNPRTSMLVHSYSKMDKVKLELHLENANSFLNEISILEAD